MHSLTAVTSTTLSASRADAFPIQVFGFVYSRFCIIQLLTGLLSSSSASARIAPFRADKYRPSCAESSLISCRVSTYVIESTLAVIKPFSASIGFSPIPFISNAVSSIWRLCAQLRGENIHHLFSEKAPALTKRR